MSEQEIDARFADPKPDFHLAAITREEWAAVKAELEALRADAARYRWLAPQWHSDPDMGGNHRWWGCQPRPMLRGPTIDEAIDRSMEAAR